MNTTPLLLFPCQIETKFQKDTDLDGNHELWIRVIPDKIIGGALRPVKSEDEKEGMRMDFDFLPDRFYFHLLLTDDKLDRWDTHPGEEITAAARQIDLNDKNWLTDSGFTKVTEVGMGIRITKLTDDYISKVVITGSITNDAATGNNRLKKLLAIHREQDGLSVLPYGSPTNNIEAEATLFDGTKRVDSSLPDDDEAKYQLGRLLGTVGLKPEDFSDELSSEEISTEPLAVRLRKAVRAILWETVVMQTKRMLSSKIDISGAKDHFINYVDGKGIFPTLRIRNQPYGVLPVKRKESVLKEGDDGISFIGSLRKYWEEQLKDVPLIFDEEGKVKDEILLNALAMEPQSSAVNFRGYLNDHQIAEEMYVRDNPGAGGIGVGYSEKTKEAQEIKTAVENLLKGKALNNTFFHLASVDTKIEPALFSKGDWPLTRKDLREGEDLKKPVSIFQYLLWHFCKRQNYDGRDRETYDDVELSVLENIIGEGALEGKLDESVIIPILTDAFYEGIDLVSHRLDAWYTSLASRDLVEKKYSGLELGVYGFVENLKKSNSGSPLAPLSQLIHTPSTSQTVAGVMAQSAFEKFKGDGGKPNPNAINLSSERVARSELFRQGLRNGQSIGALLGYELERLLIKEGLMDELYKLRRNYPMVVQTGINAESVDAYVPEVNVIDGMLLLEDFQKGKAAFFKGLKKEKFEKKVEVESAIVQLRDYLDASLDVLLYESAYQSARGNFTGAASVMRAFSGDREPPKVEGLRTPVGGTGMTHSLVVLLQSVTGDDWTAIESISGQAAPTLEKWVEQCLGKLKNISFEVAAHKIVDGEVVYLQQNFRMDLEELKIGYLDFLYLSGQGISIHSSFPVNTHSSPLDILIKHQLVHHRADRVEDPHNLYFRVLPPVPGAEHMHLLDAMGIMDGIRELLSESRPLTVSDTLPAYVKKFNIAEKSNRGLFEELKNTAHDYRKAIRNGFYNGVLKALIELELIYTQLTTTFDPVLAIDSLNRLMSGEKEGLLHDLAVAYRIKSAFAILAGNTENWHQNLVFEIEKRKATARKLLDKSKINYLDTPKLHSPQEEMDAATAGIALIQEAGKVLFGDDFVLIPPTLGDELFWEKYTSYDPKKFVGDNDQQRIQEWVQGIASVYPGAGRFEDWQMDHQAWRNTENDKVEFKIVQFTADDFTNTEEVSHFPWIALSKEEIVPLLPGDEEVVYPPGGYALTCCEMPGFRKGVSNYLSGLVVSTFSEHIPSPTINTGLGFKFDAPNSEAPQALLLAVPDSTVELNGWRFKKGNGNVVDVINEAMDLAKLRMIDLEALGDSKLTSVFPATYLMTPWKVEEIRKKLEDAYLAGKVDRISYSEIVRDVIEAELGGGLEPPGTGGIDLQDLLEGGIEQDINPRERDRMFFQFRSQEQAILVEQLGEAGEILESRSYRSAQIVKEEIIFNKEADRIRITPQGPLSKKHPPRMKIT